MGSSWRRKEAQTLPIVDSTEYLDIQEQEKIVRTLEATHLKQRYIWRVIFASFAGAFSVFFLISAYWQAVSPWETKYHSYFMDDLNAMTVVATDVGEAAVYALIAWGVLLQSSNQYHLLRISLAAGCLLAVFWFYHMQRLSRMHLNLLWLPLGPSSFAALCLYVDHLMAETEKEVHALRSSMYHFKET